MVIDGVVDTIVQVPLSTFTSWPHRALVTDGQPSRRLKYVHITVKCYDLTFTTIASAWCVRRLPSLEIPILCAASLSDTEAVLDGLAETCAQAGPINCSLAQNHTTPGSIRQSVKDLINVRVTNAVLLMHSLFADGIRRAQERRI